MSTRAQQRREKLIDELSRRIGRDLATKTVLFHHALAARLGLGATDLKCLDLLRQTNTPLTPGNLVALTGLTGGAITGVADRLEAAGFVERVRDPNDRRRWELRPLPDRHHELATLFAPLGQAISELSASYTDEQLISISDFLARLETLVDKQTERLRPTTDPTQKRPTTEARPVRADRAPGTHERNAPDDVDAGRSARSRRPPPARRFLSSPQPFSAPSSESSR